MRSRPFKTAAKFPGRSKHLTCLSGGGIEADLSEGKFHPQFEDCLPLSLTASLVEGWQAGTSSGASCDG
jgi:hypothetical protein